MNCGETMENFFYYFGEHEGKRVGYEDLSRPIALHCAGYVAKTKRLRAEPRTFGDWFLRVLDVGTQLINGSVVFTPRQFLLLPPHKPFVVETTDGPAAFYCMHITGYDMDRLLQSFGIEPGRSYDIPQSVLASVKQDFAAIFHEGTLRQPGYEELCTALAQNILIKLGRGHLEAVCNDTAAQYRKRLCASIQKIHFEYTSDLCISELAEMEHLSPSRYREIFSLAFGASPSQYLMQLRLAYAKDLLTTTDLSVAEIANTCGFQDALYFSRLFHKKLGISPVAFRNNLLGRYEQYETQVHNRASNE